MFLTKQEKDCLTLFQNKLSQELTGDVVELRLFGSRVTGQSDENSDIDVLVLVQSKNTRIKNRIWDIAAEIQIDHDVEIAPLVMTPAEYQGLIRRERLLALNIEREGIAL